jgi:uncharacterized protein YbaR (Trm112 family)
MGLSPELLDILACPQCKQPIRPEQEETVLVCDRCRLSYPVRDGIPVMLIDEAESF